MHGARDESRAGAGPDGERVRSGGRCARGPVAAALIGVLAAHGHAVAREPMPDTAFQEWRGWLERRTLDDGSVLSEYVARTDSPDEPDVALSIGFVPRFDCTPVLGIRAVGDLSLELGTALGDGDRVAFRVDGERSELVLLVDDDGRATTLWFDAPAEARERTRRLLDGGSRAELDLPDDTTLSFSLLGSRQSTAATEVACRTHEPLPYESAR